jgi:hypothetical protein
MTTIADQETQNSRIPGLILIVMGIASIALLASHPGDGPAHDFAGVLKAEATNQFVDGIVHGGFVAVLAIELFCYAIFSARMKSSAAATAGLVFFGMGVAFLSASMLLDGLVTPAIAAKYLAAPNKIEFAKSLFVLVGTMIRFVMPIGLAFQSAAMAAWGLALFASRTSRAAGAFGLVAGVALLAAFAATATSMNPIVLMGAMGVLALWAVIAGGVMFKRG